jgi:uncharacterized protein YjbJ (UPF0337 family)
MNKDQAEGKLKDVSGRVERQVGEWMGDSEKQANGAMKQAEGKVQNAWGKIKDANQKAAENARKDAAGKDAADNNEPAEIEETREIRTTRRKAS